MGPLSCVCTWQSALHCRLVCLSGALPCELPAGCTAKGRAGHTATPDARQRIQSARQRLAARQRPRRTTTTSTHGNVPSARQRTVAHDNVFLSRQRLCRPNLARRTAKEALPEMTLPCGLCHASTHGDAFAVAKDPFTVPAWRTATKTFLVVAFAPLPS
jgi:hypothetical protein